MFPPGEVEVMLSARKMLERASRPPLVMRFIGLSTSKDTPSLWCGGEVYFTHLMNALSCLFPGGERFFVVSVLKFQGAVVEPELKREMKLFCGQESLHGQQYEKFNEWLASLGYPVDELSTSFENKLKRRSRIYGNLLNLSLTAALEHLTAVLGRALLECPDVLGKIHADVRPLVIWHSIEEIEHKSVAFDVLKAVNPNYLLRMSGLMLAIVELLLNTFFIMLSLLRHDRQVLNLRSLYQLLRLGGSSGFLRESALGILRYVRFDFHPWQTDDSKYVDEFLNFVEPHVVK